MPHTRHKKHFSLEKLGFSPAAETTVLAAVIGVLGGFGALFFKKLIFFLQYLWWHTPNMYPEFLLTVPWWQRVFIPIIGGFIVGPLIYFLAREAKGPGVPEVMSAVITNNSIIRPAVVLVKTLASAISISSGGSVGREGPIVQIGAAIASTTGQILRLRPVQMKTIVGCGVAAGISATFNAPIAGTLFALELIVTDFGLTSFTPIIVAAVTSTAIIRHFQGNILEFTLPQFKMVSLWELFIYLLLGLMAGVVGYLFTRFLYIAEDFFRSIKIPEWLKPSLGGLVVGIIAISFPHIMGVGYDTIEVLFAGKISLVVMILLVFIKIFATSITIGSGGSGGVFAPSLFVGAMLGGAFGTIVNMFFPHMTGAVGAYALVGMAAVNSACTLAPLSAIIVLVELTNNYSIILPLMFTVVIASFVSRKFSPDSIYTTKLARRGIRVHMGEDLNILRSVAVKDILRHDESAVNESASVGELMDLALKKHRNVIFVIDDRGKYKGSILLQQLKHVIFNLDLLSHYNSINDFVEESPSLNIQQTLDHALTVFGDTGYDRLPVIDDMRVLRGSIIISDVIRQYNIEVNNRNITVELGAVIHSKEDAQRLHLGDKTIVTEIIVPDFFVNRSIKDIGLRKNYGVSIFLIKEAIEGGDQKVIMPGSSYVLRKGDIMLVSGKEEDVDRIITH
ncbi:MAG: chloride channel protein [Candidatus Latescibacteria bacterium]|nr:chloride channel protein [Candidatus Latescibacterota bacterium]